jgi:phosphoserine phosphatase
VDLDGTLVHTDLLLESLIDMLSRKPWLILAIPFWLAHGRSVLKHRIAENSFVDAAALPYNEELLDWLRAERSTGRRLVLATAAQEALAEKVVRHLGIFDEWMASSGAENLKGEVKERRLMERFGTKGFDYVGDSASDVAVWRSARHAVLVDPPPWLMARVRAVCVVERVFDSHAAQALADASSNRSPMKEGILRLLKRIP